jgi:DNA ligase-associated metallophosphoesterase
MEALPVEVAGCRLLLLPQRALYWPDAGLIAVADVHFGKAAAFRAQGIPVPRGTTTDNLDRLDALIERYRPRELLFLGDFLHHRSGRAEATLAALAAWRARRRDLVLTLVRGNHDRHAGDPPAELGIVAVDEPHFRGPFAFAHHPESVGGAYVFAGHLHPVYRLAARGDALRLPCFLLGREVGLLPSFGAFTGGHAVRPKPGERLFVSADDAVFEVG